MKKAMIGVVLLVLGAAAGLLYVSKNRGAPSEAPPAAGKAETAAGVCSPHGVPERDCPWCSPSLIEEKGQCGGHGVPEALCSRCDAALIPGFRAENDWCAGHDIPESQCAR